jgi:NAD-dependent DNA ligase
VNIGRLIQQFVYIILFFEDIEIRGKVYIKHSVFNLLNKLGNQFFNPRNAASVSLRQLDAIITSFVT